MSTFLRTYRWPLLAVSAAGLLVVLVWFQPQALFIDTRVDDDFPAVADAMSEPNEMTASDSGSPSVDKPSEASDEPSESTPSARPTDPVLLATGQFQDRSHPTRGTVSAYEVDGQRVLRLEDFETDNGPDLYVYLSAAPAGSSPAELDADTVDLGRLKGNLGNQNYDIPADVDLSKYSTVIIWCERFTVVFGDADLT